MSEYFGDPQNPCDQIKRSRQMVRTITVDARSRIESGKLPREKVEQGLLDFQAAVGRELGQTCSALCPRYGRCILANFGADDPLLQKGSLNTEETRELGAKVFFDELSVMAKEAMGIM